MLFFNPPLPRFYSCCDFISTAFKNQILCFPLSHNYFRWLTHPCFSSFHLLLSILANLIMRHNVINRKYWSVTKEFVLLSIYAHGQIHIHTVYSHSYIWWFGLHKLYRQKINKQQNRHSISLKLLHKTATDTEHAQEQINGKMLVKMQPALKKHGLCIWHLLWKMMGTIWWFGQ